MIMVLPLLFPLHCSSHKELGTGLVCRSQVVMISKNGQHYLSSLVGNGPSVPNGGWLPRCLAGLSLYIYIYIWATYIPKIDILTPHSNIEQRFFAHDVPKYPTHYRISHYRRKNSRIGGCPQGLLYLILEPRRELAHIILTQETTRAVGNWRQI